MKTYKTYTEKLKDPRWQKRRLELLEAAGWQCEECGGYTVTLNVHHGYYKRNTAPWDYPDHSMHVLCETCHNEVQGRLEEVHEQISRSGKFELFLLSEFVSALHDTDDEHWRENAQRIISVLLSAVLTARGIGDQPDPGKDFDWLMRVAMAAACEQSALRGYDEGILQGKQKDVIHQA